MKLLCTDLDRTLLPNGVHPESPLARPLLFHLLASCGILLGFVSGRDIDRVLRAIHDYSLPTPDLIVADVGAALYHLEGENSWQENETWRSHIAQDWKGYNGTDIAAHLQSIEGLKRQESNRQTPMKASFYYDLSVDTNQLQSTLRENLSRLGLEVSFTFSEDPQAGRGLLDILPLRASKATAVDFVASKLGVSQTDILFAGDSGNDIAALSSAMPSVMVANTDKETQKAVVAKTTQNHTDNLIYVAQGKLTVAGSTDLNGNYAAGIIEGILHFQPQWQGLLSDPEWVAEAKRRYPVSGSTSAARSA